MNTLYPGLVGTFFIFFFGTLLALFWLVHRSHMVPIPVNSIFMYFAVGLCKCSPVCPVI